MEDSKYVNILLLGETGTGKSTFINAFANYLRFASSDEVDNADLTCIIPTKFTITTEDEDLELITFGDGDNEDLGVGNSSTQTTTAYEFPYEEKIIRIIDTPGINDTRGAADKDDENFAGVLQCLAQYDELHAVCFLAKPDVTALTAVFKYCLLELLSRLSWSAAENIIFIFTRTRGTYYRAPDTLNCLRRLIADIERFNGGSVPLRFKKTERKNCFFVDNEGFKYVVARSLGFRMLDEEELKKSWDISNAASRSMIRYILGDEEHAALRPHQVLDMVSVNDARRLIYELRHPLKDVNDHVYASVNKLDKLYGELQDENLSVEQLRPKLKITRPTMKVIELEHPITVCESTGCRKVITVGGVEKLHYKQQCHNPCIHPLELHNQVPVIGALNKWCFCEAFNLLGMCRMCECHLSSHRTIYYGTELGEEVIEDQKVKVDLYTKDAVIEAKSKALKALRGVLVELKYEQNQIGLAMAQFAHFISSNAICPINDAYEEYLDHLIKKDNKGNHSSKQLVERYQCMKEDHINKKETLRQYELEAKEKNIKLVRPNDIMKIYLNLKTLRHTGKLLTDLYENSVKCVAKLKSTSDDAHANLDFNEPYMPKKDGRRRLTNAVKNFYGMTKATASAIIPGQIVSSLK